MQNYDFSLTTANPHLLVQAAGGNVYYKTGAEAAGLTAVRVKGEGGGLDVVLNPGEGIQLARSQTRFTLSKGNAGAGDIAGTFLIGAGQYFASRVQGDVSLLNPSLPVAHSYADDLATTDRRFHASLVITDTSTSGNIPVWKLRNPAASGRIVILDRVQCWQLNEPAIGYQVEVRAGVSDAPNLPAGAYMAQPRSKQEGAIQGVAVLSYGNFVAPNPVMGAGTVFLVPQPAADQTIELVRADSPLIIRPGFEVIMKPAGVSPAALSGEQLRWYLEMIERDA